MGCNSGKVSPPTKPSNTSAEHTLLAAQNPVKEAIKDPFSAESFVDQWSAVPPGGAAPPGGLLACCDTGKPAQDLFSGTWTNGVITGDKLMWDDGTVSELRIDEPTRVVEMTYKGQAYAGELRHDDKIHWDDGDVWTRRQAETTPAGATAPTEVVTSQLQDRPPAGWEPTHMKPTGKQEVENEIAIGVAKELAKAPALTAATPPKAIEKTRSEPGAEMSTPKRIEAVQSQSAVHKPNAQPRNTSSAQACDGGANMQLARRKERDTMCCC